MATKECNLPAVLQFLDLKSLRGVLGARPTDCRDIDPEGTTVLEWLGGPTSISMAWAKQFVVVAQRSDPPVYDSMGKEEAV